MLVGSLGWKRPRAYAYNGLCQTLRLRLDSLIYGQSYGVTAYLQLCLAQTVFEVEKGSVLGKAE